MIALIQSVFFRIRFERGGPRSDLIIDAARVTNLWMCLLTGGHSISCECIAPPQQCTLAVC
ncbi:hypothetical protein RESH_05749 [Rhodopirellula europaea SH398]|jgi:hypothetical protein|uniref:Uncharacterized protein n=1 Tax=Rhodopirellula europaea SH398 TaxID=1263868 RepID=M5RWG3_9BACT|nr:hypothetical protein RESH_05749 [Rhodopirellula europaea SH398]